MTMLRETLGELLRKTRVSRGEDIDEVSSATNIMPRYIEALENNDFDKFPSRTHLIGFLRNYGEYLGISVDDLMDLYKGMQISESHTPIEELTRPTSQFSIDQFVRIPAIQKAAKISVGLSIGIVLLYILIRSLEGIFSVEKSGPPVRAESHPAPGSEASATARIHKFSGSSKLSFSDTKLDILIRRKETVIVEYKFHRMAVELLDIKDNKAVIQLFPSGHIMTLEMDNEVTRDIPTFRYRIGFLLEAFTPNTVRISLIKRKPLTDISDEQEKSASSGDYRLKMRLEFLEKSYVEAYLDGNKVYAGIIQAGKFIEWEARHTIQIQLGNAAGVLMNVNGRKYTFDRKVVNKIFSWKKNPINPNKWEVIVDDNN